jgi:hypothetical protein
MGKTIASSVLPVIKYLGSAYPGTPPDKVLERLGPEDRKGFEAMTPEQWVTYELYTHILEAGAAATGTDPIQFCTDYGVFLVKNDLPMIFRMAVKFGGPSLVIMESDQIWKKYHDTGHLRAHEQLPGSTKARLEGVEGGSPLICAVVLGYIKGGLQLGGAKDLTVEHTLCRFRGDPFCEFTASWA